MPYYDLSFLQFMAEKEFRAAERLFGMLPSEQNAEQHSLWFEVETVQTAALSLPTHLSLDTDTAR